MTARQILYLLFLYAYCKNSFGCRAGDKEVGVCLHVYLERDFLSLESIVYPTARHARHRRSHERRIHNHSLHHNDAKNILTSIYEKKSARATARGKDFSSSPAELVVDYYGDRDWIEGPELADHCRRLREVIKCFEDVLLQCDSGYDFFRYRHLLYALSEAHKFVCATPYLRKERFLRFLKTIECAETARKVEASCHRHNVSSTVWNQILRVEVGEEICHAMNTQRACLLENRYITKHCQDEKRVEIYEDLTGYFLSIWCRLPLPPKLFLKSSVGRSRTESSSFWNILFSGFLLNLFYIKILDT